MEAGTSPSFFTDPIGATSAGFSSMGRAISAPFRGAATPAVDANDPTRLSAPTGQVDSATLVAWAKMKEDQRDLAGAEEFYRKAVEVSPNDHVALINYARLFHRQEKWERAVEVYRRTLQYHPNDPVAHNDLAMCYASQGKLPQGIEMANRAVQLEPGNKAYRSNLAQMLVDAKRYDEALTHLSAVHPAEVAHYNLAYLLLERNEKALARQHLTIALQMRPQFASAQKLLARASAADATAANPPGIAPAPATGTPAINVGWPQPGAPIQPPPANSGGFYNPNLPAAPPAGPNFPPGIPLEGPQSIPPGP